MLDVKIKKSSNKFFTSVYRKLIFTELYTKWNSFEPTTRKTNLVGTLSHRASKICSKSKLQEKIKQISSILQHNSYPVVINSSIRNKISRFNLEPKEGPQRCPVFFKLPWTGKIFLKFESQIKSAVQNCYEAVDPRVIFSTRKLLLAIHKDALPSIHQSMVVYQYAYRCDCRYVGRTSQRLQPKTHLKQIHTVKNLASTRLQNKNFNNFQCNSAIGLHLL